MRKKKQNCVEKYITSRAVSKKAPPQAVDQSQRSQP